jgi:predicted metalloprotease
MVLGNTEDVWRQVLPAQTGKAYRDPKLLLFTGETRSRCGGVPSGSFYCALDQTAYLDLSYFNRIDPAVQELTIAYVIARSTGHHVQNILGVLPRIVKREGELGQPEASQLTMRAELMVDCLAGVWAFHSKSLHQVTPQAVGELIAALRALGKDQVYAPGPMRSLAAMSASTPEQQLRWFVTGRGSGEVISCDTIRGRP